MTNTTQNNNSLEERVRVLEERLDKIINYFYDNKISGCGGGANFPDIRTFVE